LQTSTLLTQFDRSDIDMRLCGQPPPEFNNDYFTPAYASNGDGDSIDLRSILKSDEKWQTFSNASIRQQYADSHLLVELHARGQWHLADAAWRAGLLPAGHIVRDCMQDADFMVMKARHPYVP
jgi:hypothetical protein